jgi:hypothetical protein
LDQLQHEKEQETKLSVALARKVEQLELQLSEAGGERSAMVAQLERMRREQQEQLMQQQRALSTVGGATQQYHNQIKQTQELLKVSLHQNYSPFLKIKTCQAFECDNR